MRKGWSYAIQIALSLVVVMGLAMGCAAPSSTLVSKYPADISSRVTIAEKLRVQKYPEDVAPNREEDVFWIVDISVKNNTYENEIMSSYSDWQIVSGDKAYEPKRAPGIIPPHMSVSLGQTGQTTFRFNIPRTLRIGDVEICYRGQEPYSYGSLSGGDTVAVYDWDLGRALTEVCVARVVGKPYVGWFTLDLRFELEPTDLVVAGKVYEAKLYEKGSLRSVTSISWSQPQLNVKKVKSVGFPLSYEERRAYFFEDISHIFSVKVCEWQ